MALCMWRDDWPPHSEDVRRGILEYNEFDLTKPFTCRHPPEGPEEFQCYTTVNITYSKCVYYSSMLRDILPGTIKIQPPNSSRQLFSLCRLDLHCNVHPRKHDIEPV